MVDPVEPKLAQSKVGREEAQTLKWPLLSGRGPPALFTCAVDLMVP